MVSSVSGLMEAGLGIKDKTLLKKLAKTCGGDSLKELEEYLKNENGKSLDDLTEVITNHYETSKDIISKSQCRTFVMRVKYLSDWFSLMKGGAGSIDCWADFSRTRFISFYRQVQALETASSDDDDDDEEEEDDDDGEFSVMSTQSTYSYHTSPKPWRMSKANSSPRLGLGRNRFGSSSYSPAASHLWKRTASYSNRYQVREEPSSVPAPPPYPEDEVEVEKTTTTPCNDDQPVSLADTSVTYQSLTPDSKLSPQGSSAESDEESEIDLDEYHETYEGPMIVLRKSSQSFPDDEVTLTSDYSIY
uniref:Uncharacterized protein n=1 Tax=Grammatophora oceanica TaxID=210454 RepID=A0A7S1UQT4_9STRA|mmetsp:Transcript_1797/g.2424  ORF Transcript_1797/g.2424 Transcript_1797/m.2424 type:complete len:304 (+) Transcript_1797:367-1278(+)|eukprot:CAMPEP_0194035518 /NCGR_PEP_ID=MMETSP0009_2-20130614/7936_1 /TAXON_ID=210454 /ORGANISM="Grammatophora oceanica, Strain CCMP 410" /LENGTH=303 /DNA_ID=CAMNT_0038676903 /DNA_START=159 /DNA_END=1070 /DNA_ORIENTATION=+